MMQKQGVKKKNQATRYTLPGGSNDELRWLFCIFVFLYYLTNYMVSSRAFLLACFGMEGAYLHFPDINDQTSKQKMSSSGRCKRETAIYFAKLSESCD